MRRWGAPAAILAAALLCACQSVPLRDPGRPPSHALAAPEETALGRLAASAAPDRQDVSGLRLVAGGRDAFALTVALAEAAERTLDLQYYAWRDDLTGRTLLAHVLSAAERGVRVRILIDDLEAPAGDAALSLLSRHPNLEVRLFNPFPWRQSRRLNLILRLDPLNHRMHNKAMVADNAVALVGGRNVGDQYATISGDRPNYRDLDLLAVGPVVRGISETFDAFWNSRWSIRPHILAGPSAGGNGSVAAAVAAARRVVAAERHPFAGAARRMQRRLAEVVRDLTWGPAIVLADLPDKPDTRRSRVLELMQETIGGAVQRDVLIETAYLIVGAEERAALCGLVGIGMRVRILTNSLASTDSVAAGAAYRPDRAGLIACGVELHEMRHRPAFAAEWPWAPPGTAVSLHSKAGVFDGRYVFVGSYNLDHRSRDLNTELALMVDSRELAREVAAFILRGMAPENAYRLRLSDDGRVVWDGAGGVSEPGSGFWRLVAAGLLSALPEDQL